MMHVSKMQGLLSVIKEEKKKNSDISSVMLVWC